MRQDYRKTYKEIYQPKGYCVCNPGVPSTGWLFLTHKVSILVCLVQTRWVLAGFEPGRFFLLHARLTSLAGHLGDCTAS